MELADVRDWIIVIYGAVGVIATIAVLTLIIITYTKVSRILDSLHVAANNIRDTTSVISDVIVKPFAKMKSLMENIRKMAGIWSPASEKKGGNPDES